MAGAVVYASDGLARTDAAGKFQLETRRPQAKGMIWVEKEGFALCEYPALVGAPKQAEVRISLGREELIGGLVVRPDGRPVAGATVMANVKHFEFRAERWSDPRRIILWLPDRGAHRRRRPFRPAGHAARSADRLVGGPASRVPDAQLQRRNPVCRRIDQSQAFSRLLGLGCCGRRIRPVHFRRRRADSIAVKCGRDLPPIRYGPCSDPRELWRIPTDFFDGKAIKKVAKRLKALRGASRWAFGRTNVGCHGRA